MSDCFKGKLENTENMEKLFENSKINLSDLIPVWDTLWTSISTANNDKIIKNYICY